MRPPYRTATRSQVSATTPKVVGDQDDAHRQLAVAGAAAACRIWSWIVTSSAVVGSSASSSFGSAASAMRDHRALPHAAGEFVRVTRRDAAARRECRPGPAVRSARARAARPRKPRCSARFSSICRPIGQHRVRARSSAPGRSWRFRRRAASASRVPASVSRSRPRHSDTAGGLRDVRQQAQDGAQRQALARAGFADEAEHLAGIRRRS